jgi:hypothetical protein
MLAAVARAWTVARLGAAVACGLLLAGVLAAATSLGVAQLEATHPPTGQFVEVQGVGPVLGDSPIYITSAAPSFVVTSVKQFTEGVTANQGDHVIVEGYVSGLSGTTFTIEGTAVNAGTLSLLDIANSTNVRVEGTFNNGVLNASKITLL